MFNLNITNLTTLITNTMAVATLAEIMVTALIVFVVYAVYTYITTEVDGPEYWSHKDRVLREQEQWAQGRAVGSKYLA